MRAIAQLLSLLVSMVAMPLAALLLCVAVTWAGRGFAAAVLLSSAALLVLLFGRPASLAQRRRFAAMLGGGAVALFALVALRAPSGTALTSARVRHLYPENERHGRWSVANLVPEVDQLMAGFTAMTFIDSLLTQRQAGPLKEWTREIYRELEGESDFRELGSVMRGAYAELRGGAVPEHAFLYIPPTVDRSKPVPALVFFHGSGGNFKAYLWLISKLADRLNMVVIAPSCGMGNWTTTETRMRTAGALAAARRTVSIDSAQLHVIGLSNGGRAVSQLLAAAPRDYASFTFLSPVFDGTALRGLRPASIDAAPDVFILSGALDDRVPLTHVENHARDLRRTGAAVSFEAVGDANHFLVFSHRTSVGEQLERWLRSVGPRAGVQ